MHLRTFISDDECAFKLPHVFAIDTEIGLQWVFHFYTRRDINETAATPDSTVKSCELVIRRRDDRTEVFLHQVWVFFDSGIGIEEHHTDFI